MIRHIGQLKWTAGTTKEQHQAVLDQLRLFPEIIPEIKSYELHSDACLKDGNADLLVIGEFADADGFNIYATHPEHLDIIAQYIKPIVENRSVIQYEM